MTVKTIAKDEFSNGLAPYRDFGMWLASRLCNIGNHTSNCGKTHEKSEYQMNDSSACVRQFYSKTCFDMWSKLPMHLCQHAYEPITLIKNQFQCMGSSFCHRFDIKYLLPSPMDIRHRQTCRSYILGALLGDTVYLGSQDPWFEEESTSLLDYASWHDNERASTQGLLLWIWLLCSLKIWIYWSFWIHVARLWLNNWHSNWIIYISILLTHGWYQDGVLLYRGLKVLLMKQSIFIPTMFCASRV